jgi:hypothetical protein
MTAIKKILLICLGFILGFSNISVGAQKPTEPQGQEISEEIYVPAIDGARTQRIEIKIQPELIDKLNAEQLSRIIRRSLQKPESPLIQLTSEGVLVPFVVFSSISLIMMVYFYLAFRRNQTIQETLRTIVTSGRDIPESFFASFEAKRQPTPEGDLRKGLIFLAFGLGLMGVIFFANPQVSEDGSWSVGLLPSLVGLAYLALWALHRPKNLQEG